MNKNFKKVEDSQFGDKSINVGSADFRGANIIIGDNTIQNEQSVSSWDFNPKRKKLLKGKGFRMRNILTLSTLGSIASIISLLIALNYFSSSFLIILSFLLLSVFFVSSLAVILDLKSKKFQVLPGDMCLELRSDNMLFLTKISGTCPICGGDMYLENIGPKGKMKIPYLICRKNFRLHRFEFDFTTLSEIE